ncbi:MAG: hypothetical protein U0W40_20295 [Acidimicrobiia bacterium]
MTRSFVGRTRALFVVGVAALVTTTGLVGLAATGTSAGAAQADASPELTAAAELASYLPLDQRGECARVDPTTFAEGRYANASAVASCLDVAADVDRLLYVRFASLADLQQAYSEQLPAGISTGESGTPCPVETTWSYDGEGGGNDACFTDTITPDGGDATTVAKMVWTAEDQLILGFAVNDAADADALKKWWSDSSGPLQEPDTEGLAPLTAAAWAKDGKRLIGTLPAAVSKCKTLDAPFADESLRDREDPSYAYAPYLATEVDCSAPKGSVRYSQLTPETAARFAGFLRLYVYDSEYPGLKKPAVCRQTTDLKVGKKTVGEILCWYNQDTLWVAWYNDRTGVVGGYTTSRSPVDALKYARANLVS